MQPDRASVRQIGIPIEFDRRDRHCEMTLDQLKALFQFRVTTQRSLQAMGSKLGSPLYVVDGFLEFELSYHELTGAKAVVAQIDRVELAREIHEAGTQVADPDERAAADSSISMGSSQEVVSAELDRLGPLLAAAPGAKINRAVLNARLRTGPAVMRVDGQVVPWAATASPKTAPEASVTTSPLVLERVGDVTLLRTILALYRTFDLAQARAMDVGERVVFERSNEQRCLVARAGAIRAQGDLFSRPDVDFEDGP